MTGTAGRLLLVAFALAAATSCAPKAVPAVTPGAPRYPEFIFPKAAPGMAGDVLAQHEAAWRFLQAGDVKAAERGFAQLARTAPELYPAHAGLGYAALARKDHKAALEHFNHALATDTQYVPALTGRGQTYLAMGEHARALESFDAALALEPNLTTIRNSADVLRLQVMQGGVAAARKAAAEGNLVAARVAYEQAIMTSPQSPFLFREIAVVELKDGRLQAALAHARKAVELEPSDARNHVAVADVLEALGEFPQALESLTAAAALEPGEALNRRIESLSESAARAAMPEAYRAIEAAPALSRAQLAALIGVQLSDVLQRAPERGTGLMTDVRDSWASQWILPVTRAGFMEVFPNHTFQPEAIVQRGDLARAVSQILNVVAAGRPQLASQLRNARRRFTDLPPGHLRHGAASMAVEAGVMSPLEDGSFQLTRPVTGVEALAAIAKLRELAGAGR
jgi:tetratricopeptide (TPR) repeat protein